MKLKIKIYVRIKLYIARCHAMIIPLKFRYNTSNYNSSLLSYPRVYSNSLSRSQSYASFKGMFFFINTRTRKSPTYNL